MVNKDNLPQKGHLTLFQSFFILSHRFIQLFHFYTLDKPPALVITNEDFI